MLEDEQLILDRTIKLNCAGRQVPLKLRGIIYHGAAHFTAQIITSSGSIWFNDGIATKGISVSHGSLSDLTSVKDLHICNRRKAVAAVYAVQ
ncbi:hypothetical protein FB451DRAFT_1044504 [Mycena latifolia]|nr:hypothetical protein FB451DRAFT_1044504 [Mycena latifolia]